MIETRGIRSEIELREATRLTLEAFSNGGSDEAIDRKISRVLAHPSYEPGRIRVRMVGGRIVSHLWIIERTMRLGSAEWRMGGIGGVCTAPDARGQGHASALLQDALALMRQEGFDISLLDGIRDFYNRLGYAVIWPHSHLLIPVEEARALRGDCDIRKISIADIPTLARLYHTAWGQRPGSLVRQKAHWRWFLEVPRPAWAATNGKGRVQGYAIVSEHRPDEVIELVAANSGAAYALIRHITDSLGDHSETIRINVARDDPLVRWLRRACRVTLTERTSPAGGWMARFVNLEQAMTKIQDELSARFLRSPMQDWRGRVNLVTDMGAIALFCRYSRVVVRETAPTVGYTCRILQDRLIQLVLGFRSVEDVAEDPDVAIPEIARPLLNVLFPPQAAYIAGLDWF